MSDVAPGGTDGKLLATVTKPRERPARAPASRCCAAPSWWNGWRDVVAVVAMVGTDVARWAWSVPRAKCSACKRGFTCYPPGLYPRRQYQIDVVALVVAAVVVGAHSFACAAREANASASSARRWTRWVADMATPSDLVCVATRIDPDGASSTGLSARDAPTTVRGRAAHVLVALEHLGAALLRRGIACVVERSGLGRVLGWQHRAHAEVVQLCRPPDRLSPAMALWQEAVLA